MVVERQILPYLEWLLHGSDGGLGALPRFALVLAGSGLAMLVLGFVVAAARNGLARGGDLAYRTVSSGFVELLQTKFRRVWALAALAIKEAWRRRVFVALAVYLVVLLFAQWFLTTDHSEPARLYLSFVLTASTYLTLGIGLVLSAFSLPNDFKTKTIFTVVTKPVRAGEIVLGRILGFTIIGTSMLAVMALASYVFVNRSLDHVHVVESTAMENVTDSAGKFLGVDGVSERAMFHKHAIELDEDGVGRALQERGHTHNVEKIGDKYVMSSPIGFMKARVPQYGKLRFIDRNGVEKDAGISVGMEWKYRSFIDGNTQAAAIWTFEGLDPDSDADYLDVALTVRVFRTHKGVIGRPITGTIRLRNPDDGKTNDAQAFSALDQQVDERSIGRSLFDADGNPLDLFKDLVGKDGRLELIVQCLEGGQYFGFAQADCYVRQPEGDPRTNFVKVCLSIWVQMVIVIAIGVTVSTLVSGPVAMLFTAAFILLGFFRAFFVDVATGVEYGGGPVESLVRLVTQKNVMVPLDPGAGTTIVKSLDGVFKGFMWCVAQVLPDFRSLSAVRYAADGYNVPWDRVWQDLTVCGAYVAGLSILGFFLLRTREVAR
ncbi:MAG: ABC transporter permease [Pirellulales bacterium]|nr:ABC transporter permease [Pirellulales bacterium]